MKRVYSGLLEVDPVPVRCLDEMFDVVESRMDRADYLVGWMDTFARGGELGRGLIHRRTTCTTARTAPRRRRSRVANQELPPTLMGVVPKSIMWALMRPFTNDPACALVNFAKYRMSVLEGSTATGSRTRASRSCSTTCPTGRRRTAPAGSSSTRASFPRTRTRRVREILERSHRAGLTPYLGVFKRHRVDPFLMTHAVDGYSLALDFKVTAANRRRLWEHAAS
jgi:hypothetical protein